MARDDGLVYAEGAAERAHLVLVEPVEGFDNTALGALLLDERRTHVMVALDHVSLRANALTRLDQVRIQGALGQEVVVAEPEPRDLPLLHVDEQVAYRVALGLGVGQPSERGQEIRLGVGAADMDGPERVQGAHHLDALVLAHEARVDVQEIDSSGSQGLEKQGRRHRRVDAAGYQEQHRGSADALEQALALLDDVALHRPGAFAAA